MIYIVMIGCSYFRTVMKRQGRGKLGLCCGYLNYETHLCLSLHVLISGEKLLALSLASSMSTESGLSELE